MDIQFTARPFSAGSQAGTGSQVLPTVQASDAGSRISSCAAQIYSQPSPLTLACLNQNPMGTREVSSLSAKGRICSLDRDKFRENISLEETACIKLSYSIRHKYFELGSLLGLSPAFLLNRWQRNNTFSEIFLKVIVNVVQPLTFGQLLQAVGTTAGVYSGLFGALEKLGREMQLEQESTLSPAQRQRLMPYLMGLKSRAHLLGLGLGLPAHRIKNLAHDLEFGDRCEAMLARVITVVPSFSPEQLIAALGSSSAFTDLVRSLRQWLEVHPEDGSKCLTELVKQPAFMNLLCKIAPEWDLFGQKLGMDQDLLEDWKLQTYKRSDIGQRFESVLHEAALQRLLTRENVFHALCCMDEASLALSLAHDDWGITPTSCTFPLPMALWRELQEYHRQGVPLPVALVYSVLQDKLAKAWWIRLVFNLPPLISYPGYSRLSDDTLLAQTLLEASVKETLTLEAVAEVFQVLDVFCPSMEPLPVLPATAESAPLQWRDIARLVDDDNSALALSVAMCTALLLGIRLDNNSRHRRADSVWGEIVTITPRLETGHLHQLFCQHPILAGSIDNLPYGAQTPAATLPLSEVCPRATEFSQLVKKLEQRPELTQMWQRCCAGIRQLVGLPKPFRVLYMAVADPNRMTRLLQEVSNPPSSLSRSREPDEYCCPITRELMTEDPVAIPADPSLGSDKMKYNYFSKIALIQALLAGQQRPSSTGLQGKNPLTNAWLTIADVEGQPVDEYHRDEICQWQREQADEL